MGDFIEERKWLMYLLWEDLIWYDLIWFDMIDWLTLDANVVRYWKVHILLTKHQICTTTTKQHKTTENNKTEITTENKQNRVTTADTKQMHICNMIIKNKNHPVKYLYEPVKYQHERVTNINVSSVLPVPQSRKCSNMITMCPKKITRIMCIWLLKNKKPIDNIVQSESVWSVSQISVRARVKYQ